MDAPPRKIVQDRPFNAEAPLSVLDRHPTPDGRFYVRCNFDIPTLDPLDYRLGVSDGGRASRTFTLDELRALGQRRVGITLECAGNGRALMQPVPGGTRWQLGAISSADFTGVPLRSVLALAGVPDSTQEVLFTGHDAGTVEPGRHEAFARSLPLREAMAEDVLLAWAMNDSPLRPEHGAPLRLVVPGWYGIASVKWLRSIELLDSPFTGHFQRERYVYIGDAAEVDHAPVTRMRVRSLIVTPAHGDAVRVGRPLVIAGIASSGHASIESVAVQVDGGAWVDAVLEPPIAQHVHRRWTLEWQAPTPGKYRLRARARDAAGNVQPLDPPYNELGYGNNVAHAIVITAR